MLLEEQFLFQMSSYARAYVYTTCEKTKGKFPWDHHVVWNGKTKTYKPKRSFRTGQLSSVTFQTKDTIFVFLFTFFSFINTQHTVLFKTWKKVETPDDQMAAKNKSLCTSRTWSTLFLFSVRPRHKYHMKLPFRKLPIFYFSKYLDFFLNIPKTSAFISINNTAIT